MLMTMDFWMLKHFKMARYIANSILIWHTELLLFYQFIVKIYQYGLHGLLLQSINDFMLVKLKQFVFYYELKKVTKATKKVHVATRLKKCGQVTKFSIFQSINTFD